MKLNRDQIKSIAVFTMLLNHIANIFLIKGTFVCELLKDIGYFACPVMCWFLVEGYRYTGSVKKYAQRMLVFAILSQIPYYLAFGRNEIAPWYTMNILFTLFLCLCILIAEEKIFDQRRKMSVIFLMVAASVICDWAILAPAYTLLFYHAGKEKKKQWEAFLIAAVFLAITVAGEFSGFSGVLPAAGAALSVLAAGVCVLVFYNGEKSRRHVLVKKYFFYLFYPVHLVILALLKI